MTSNKEIGISALIFLTKQSKVVFSFCPFTPPCLLPVLSEWSRSSVCAAKPPNHPPAAPPSQYVCESVLQGWCREAEWMEEALVELRRSLGPRLQQVSLQARGRALGGCHTLVD